MSVIVRLDKLESPSLQNAGITDDDLAQIAKLTKLRTLMLGNYKVPGKSNVTDRGLQSLKSLTKLTWLTTGKPGISTLALEDSKAVAPSAGFSSKPRICDDILRKEHENRHRLNSGTTT